MKEYTNILNEYENRVIDLFRKHPVLSNLASLSKNDFEKLLLQQKFVAFQFTPLYDEAECFLQNSEARKVVRHLREEEYPSGKQSHRQDLFTDLDKIGISKERIGREKETEETRKAITRLYDLVRYKSGETQSEYDVRSITGLRMAEEVLVAEAYNPILVELNRRYGLSMKDSVFYLPHFQHDIKKVPLGSKGSSHSDEFGEVIAGLVTNRKMFEVTKSAMNKAYTARKIIYDQFR